MSYTININVNNIFGKADSHIIHHLKTSWLLFNLVNSN